MAVTKEERRLRIKRRIRKRVKGTTERPRLSVYRSNNAIHAQIIDDVKGITLVSASSLSSKELNDKPKKEQSKVVGEKVAKLALEKGIKEIVFDRNGYLYHGRIQSLADGAREGGLVF